MAGRRVFSTGCIALATLLALSLSGCVPAAKSQPSASQSPTRTSNPTPTPASFQLSCADTVTSATLAAIDTGLALRKPDGYSVAPPSEPGLSVSSARFYTPVFAPSAATVLSVMQTGFFECDWGNSSRAVVLSALPAGTSAFDSQVARETYDAAAFPPSGVGDRSASGCASLGQDTPYCDINVLEGTLYLNFMVYEPDGFASVDLASVQGTLKDAATSALTAIAASPAPPAPMVQPASRWSTMHDCSEVSAGIAKGIPGAAPSPGEAFQPLIEDDAYNPVFRLALQQSVGFECRANQTDIVAAIVPGAGWALPLTYADPSVTAPVPVVAAGASAARYLCASNACWVEGVVDGAFVAVFDGSTTGSTTKDELTATLVGIAQTTASKA